MDITDCACVGSVVRMHGVRGELEVQLNGSWKHRGRPKAFFMEINGELVPFFVDKMSPLHGSYVIRFDDLNDANEAGRFVNTNLYLPLDTIEHTGGGEDEVSGILNITGFKVIDRNAGELGVVEEVLSLPMQSLAKIIRNDKEILFPVNIETVLKRDRKKKVIYTNLPEGLLDLYLK